MGSHTLYIVRTCGNMKLYISLLSLCLFAIVFPSTLSLDCFPCWKRSCANQVVDPESCASGQIIKDHCNCCNVCAKALGEECGGDWDEYGTCATPFICNHDYDYETNQNTAVCVEDINISKV